MSRLCIVVYRARGSLSTNRDNSFTCSIVPLKKGGGGIPDKLIFRAHSHTAIMITLKSSSEVLTL